MCDRHMDTADWTQYHPVLQSRWSTNIDAYAKPNQPIEQEQPRPEEYSQHTETCYEKHRFVHNEIFEKQIPHKKKNFE